MLSDSKIIDNKTRLITLQDIYTKNHIWSVWQDLSIFDLMMQMQSNINKISVMGVGSYWNRFITNILLSIFWCSEKSKCSESKIKKESNPHSTNQANLFSFRLWVEWKIVNVCHIHYSFMYFSQDSCEKCASYR